MTSVRPPTVPAAIIGLGWWGRRLVASVDGRNDITFVRAVSKDLEESAAFARCHQLELTTELDDVLHDDRVEAVVLATPHSLHVEQIRHCAEAGKHVFSEKPLALTLAGARDAVAACRQGSVILGLGTDRRFLPAVEALTQLVRSGQIGTVLHLEAHYSNDNSLRGLLGAWRHSPSEAPGAAMTGPGLHALDAIVHLGGQVATAAATTHEFVPPPTSVDTTVAMLQMASSATAVLAAVRGIPEHFRIMVAGDAGWAEVRDMGTLVTADLAGDRSHQSFSSELATGRLLGMFAAAIRGVEPFPVSTDSMLSTVAAFEAILESLSTGSRTTVESIGQE